MSRRIEGVIFSDLGQASKFMALDWVPPDARLWQQIQREVAAVPLAPVPTGFCSAGLYFVSLQRLVDGEETVRGAVLLPAVVDYPKDKIEVVAQVRIKDALSVKDGDRLVLEFDD